MKPLTLLPHEIDSQILPQAVLAQLLNDKATNAMASKLGKFHPSIIVLKCQTN